MTASTVSIYVVECEFVRHGMYAISDEMLTYNIIDFTVETSGLAVFAKCLHHVGLLEQSVESSLDTLSKIGEQPLRDISDNTLHTDMMTMNEIIRNTSDDYILNLHENRSKKIIVAMKIYSNLAYMLHLAKPYLVGALTLRMVELTMTNGLVPSSPFAFASYGVVQAATGNIAEGCRLGRYHCVLTVL